MRKILLVALTVVTGFMVACDDHDVLPAPTATTMFNAATSLSHDKDTVNSAGGDVIVLTCRGGINDTSVAAKAWGITAAVKAVDSATNFIVAAQLFKTISVTYDTVDMYKTKLYRWTAKISLPLPAIPVKSKIKATSLFTYGLNLSSQTGNQTATDTKFIYVK
jgi:hypothetical protein